MIIEAGSKFNTSFINYKKIGFHATSIGSSSEIEEYGIYPHKIYDLSVHNELISIAIKLEIDVLSYIEWLGMRSVTFTKSFEFAWNHVIQGSAAGGQGLINMMPVLQEIKSKGDITQQSIASSYLSKLNIARSTPAVIYAVDLSHLNGRLVDKADDPLYQLYWRPDCELPPSEKLITPIHLIARLDLQ